MERRKKPSRRPTKIESGGGENGVERGGGERRTGKGWEGRERGGGREERERWRERGIEEGERERERGWREWILESVRGDSNLVKVTFCRWESRSSWVSECSWNRKRSHELDRRRGSADKPPKCLK